MQSDNLIRDAARVRTHWKITTKDEMVAIKPVKIYIPARYRQSDMAIFENEKSFMGIFAMVVDDTYYGVSLVSSFIRSEPTAINDVIIDDEDYIELYYDPGARIMTNVNVPKVDSFLYRISDEFDAKGKIPWFMSYEDLGKLFENSGYYNGRQIGYNPQVNEMIAATISRDPDDVKKYFRQRQMGAADGSKPTVIPLRAVSYGATNAIAKLMGPYFDENVTSTLVSPGQRVENIERLLRT